MNLNIAQICGRMTKNPEPRVTPSGVNILNFSVATNKVWNDQQGQRQEKTEFHNVVAFGKVSEIITRYFKKGDEIYIQGRLQTTSWEDQQGVKKYKTEIVAEKMDFGQKAKANQAPASTGATPANENRQHDTNYQPIQRGASGGPGGEVYVPVTPPPASTGGERQPEPWENPNDKFFDTGGEDEIKIEDLPF